MQRFLSIIFGSFLPKSKKDLPKRTGPLNLYQCDNYSSTAACAAAIKLPFYLGFKRIL